METNTNQTNNQAADPIDQFLNQILDEKKITGETPEVRQQLVEELRDQLMEQINRAMVDALSSEQLDQLNQLLDSTDEALQPEAVQNFMRESGINGEQITLSTMLRFREYYLGTSN